MTTEARERPAAKLLQRAVAALARREHSRAELARKLARWLEEDQGAADIDAVLDELQHRNLLSEERYAASVVRARATRYGDARVAQDLRARGVPSDVAKAALVELRGSEYARARAQWARRFKSLPATFEDRARQARFLQARGFSSAVIRRVLRGDPESETTD